MVIRPTTEICGEMESIARGECQHVPVLQACLSHCTASPAVHPKVGFIPCPFPRLPRADTMWGRRCPHLPMARRSANRQSIPALMWRHPTASVNEQMTPSPQHALFPRSIDPGRCNVSCKPASQVRPFLQPDTRPCLRAAIGVEPLNRLQIK